MILFFLCQSYQRFLKIKLLKKKKEIKKQQDKEINDEIDLQRLHHEINSREIPKEIEFYFGGLNENIFLMCSSLNLSRENSDFIDFLSSGIGSQVLRENMLSSHIESGNIFYDNYNTNQYTIFHGGNKMI